MKNVSTVFEIEARTFDSEISQLFTKFRTERLQKIYKNIFVCSTMLGSCHQILVAFHSFFVENDFFSWQGILSGYTTFLHVKITSKSDLTPST